MAFGGYRLWTVEALKSWIYDWKYHCFTQTRKHRSPCAQPVCVESKCPGPSDRLLSQDAASQARLRVFLYILFTFLYILISLTHELWRCAQFTSGFRAHIVPCVPGMGSLFFRGVWSCSLCNAGFTWSFLARSRCLRSDHCAPDALSTAVLSWMNGAGFSLRWGINVIPCPTFIAEKNTVADWCESPPLKYVLPEHWSCCDHVSMHMVFVLTVLTVAEAPMAQKWQ